MIDPQLQGIRWILNREEPNGLRVIQQSQPKYIDQVIGKVFLASDLSCLAGFQNGA